MVSLLDLTHDEAYALAIVSLYCDSKEISSKDGKNVGNAIPNKKKQSLCRAEWKKQAIASNLPTLRSKAAYYWFRRITQPMHDIFLDITRSWLVKRKIDSISLLPTYYCTSMA